MGHIFDRRKGNKDKPKAAPSPLTETKSKPDLKGLDFAAGASLLSPSGPATKLAPPDAGKAAQAPAPKPAEAQAPAPKPAEAQAPKPAEAPADKAAAAPVDAVAQAVAPAPAQAAPAGLWDAPTAAQAADDELKKKNDALAKYWTRGKDDAGTVIYVAGKGSTPEMLDAFRTSANSHATKLKQKPEYARYKKVMSDKEIALVFLYTTQAAYAMNAILRGQLASERWMESYGQILGPTMKALEKVPRGAANLQYDEMLDPSQAPDDVVRFDKTYRSDAWNGAFEEVFANDYCVGRGFEEPGFFSTSTVAGAYNKDFPVHRTITDVTTAKSISQLSDQAKEKEAVFPPGTRFRITSIEAQDEKTGKRTPVADPKALFQERDKGPQAFNRDGLHWHVTMKQVAVAKGKKEKKQDRKDNKDIKRAPQINTKEPGLLERLLGLKHADG